jgi:hypothetical protein
MSYSWKNGSKNLIVATSLAVVILFGDRRDSTADTKSGVLVTISKETTYITEPLRPDGYPDYIGALNERLSKGVTPENNAAVLLWKAMGPADIYEPIREQYFQMLGIPPLPEKGDYFVSSESQIKLNENSDAAQSADKRSRVLRDQYELILKRPWSRQEFPVWAAWLDANEKPLALIIEASKRPRRYDPLVGGARTPVIAALLPAGSALRHASNALAARAMLRIHDGKPDDAWADLLACYRLARLAAQSTSTVDDAVGAGINERASSGTCALLSHPRLDVALITRMRADFESGILLPDLVEPVNIGERFVYLDFVRVVATYQPATPDSVGKSLDYLKKQGMTDLASWKLVLEASGDRTIDWDTVLRAGNALYDRYAAAVRRPMGMERLRLVRKIDESRSAASDGSGGEQAEDDRESRARRLAAAFAAAYSTPLITIVGFSDRTAVRSMVTQLALALAKYRADRASYPAKLDDLKPDYVREVPNDPFNDAPLHYRPEKDGYLLYSVGINGKDDGGLSYVDRKHDEDWDDIAVRMPSRAD